MKQEGTQLNRDDLQQLMREPSAKVRATLCAKICNGYNDQAYSERESELVVEILRLLLKDTSLRVRRTLGEELQNNPHLPHDIVMSLVNDHELVAEAILGSSPVLEEEDLLAIIQSTHNLRKLMAIAGRDTLSSGVADALVDHGEHPVTLRVISNSGANIDDSTFSYILDEYYQDDSVLEALVYRSNLPYNIAEKLFYLVGDSMQKKLAEEHGLRLGSFDEIAKNATEGAMLRFLSPWMGQQDIQQLVQEMYKQERLTDSLIIRSLCIGDLRFFQTSMAKRAGVSVSNAKILLLDPHGDGFDACYEKANLAEGLRDAVRCLYQFALEETQLGRYFHEQFTQNMIQRITADNKAESVDQMPALLSMLGNSSKEAARHVH